MPTHATYLRLSWERGGSRRGCGFRTLSGSSAEGNLTQICLPQALRKGEFDSNSARYWYSKSDKDGSEEQKPKETAKWNDGKDNVLLEYLKSCAKADGGFKGTAYNEAAKKVTESFWPDRFSQKQAESRRRRVRPLS